MVKKCDCGEAQLVMFGCVCDWCNSHPGNNNYVCEYCGIYTASQPICNKCELCEPGVNDDRPIRDE